MERWKEGQRPDLWTHFLSQEASCQGGKRAESAGETSPGQAERRPGFAIRERRTLQGRWEIGGCLHGSFPSAPVGHGTLFPRTQGGAPLTLGWFALPLQGIPNWF